MAHISLDEIQQRAYLKNPELVDQLMERRPYLLHPHDGALWQAGNGSPDRPPVFEDSRIYQIYRPLNNKAFDKLFADLRTQFGSFGIKRNDTIRDIIKLKQDKTKSVVIFLADQTPSKANLHYRTEFLHQDTAILTGPERIARKLNLPVIFLDTRKSKKRILHRRHEADYGESKETPENYITERYARLLEKMILRDPAYWLWTHKRWKHKHEQQG